MFRDRSATSESVQELRCSTGLPEDGTTVPKHVGVDIYHEFYFMTRVLLSVFVGWYSENILCLKTGCCGGYSSVRGTKQNGHGEKCRLESFIIFIPPPPKDVKRVLAGMRNAYGTYVPKTCYSEGWIWWDNIKVEFKERVVHDCWGDPIQSPLSSCVITLRRINIYFVRFAIHSYIMIANSEFFCWRDKYFCNKVGNFSGSCFGIPVPNEMLKTEKWSWFTTSTKETNTFICLARSRGCSFWTRTEAA